MKTGNNNISLWMWEGGGSGSSGGGTGLGIEGKHCDKSCVLVVIVMIQRDKSETFFSLQWESARLGVLQLLRFPPSPVSPSKTSFMPLWMWHAGNTMKQAWTQTTLPLAPGPHCGTRWEEMLGQGETQLGPLHPQLTIYSRESKDKGQSRRYVLAFWALPCYYRHLFMPFTLTKFILYILQSAGSQVCGG